MRLNLALFRLGRPLALLALLVSLFALTAWPGTPATALTVEGVGPGYITTVAGGGENDYRNGGPADQANIASYFSRITVDREGNLFFISP